VGVARPDPGVDVEADVKVRLAPTGAIQSSRYPAFCLFLLLSVLAALPAARAQQSAPPAFVMPAGPGKDTFVSVCSLCHDPTTVVGKFFTKVQWEAKVIEMLQEEPEVTTEERAAIVEYLSAHFKPGAKIYVNVIGAKDLAAALDVSLDEATALVRRREQQGSFKGVDDLSSAGVDAAKIEARKDRLAF
jgi:competence protein ComEA